MRYNIFCFKTQGKCKKYFKERVIHAMLTAMTGLSRTAAQRGLTARLTEGQPGLIARDQGEDSAGRTAENSGGLLIAGIQPVGQICLRKVRALPQREEEAARL